MKTLDLNAYGVQEMNHQEMKDINGGEPISLTAVLVIGVVVGVVAGIITFFATRDR